MPSNSTQNETAGWITPVAGGGFGLVGLFFILIFVSWAMRFSAREARRNNPQRVLTDQYFDELGELTTAAKKERRLYQCARSLIERMTGGQVRWPCRYNPTGDQVDPSALRRRLRLLLEASGDSASTAELEAANTDSPVEFVMSI